MLLIPAFFLLSSLSFVTPSSITSPSNLQGLRITTVSLHEHIGTAEIPNGTVTTNLVFVTSQHVCDTENMLLYNNSVVLIDLLDDYFQSLAQQQDMMLCAQAGNAVATIMNYHEILVPGYTLYFNQGVKNKLSIPALNTADPDISELRDAFEAGTPVVIELTEDNNEWKALWASAAFIVMWRVFLPLMNGFGFIRSLHSIYFHANEARPKQTNGFGRKREQQRLLFVGSVIESCAFAIRFSYCAVGPLYSNPTLPYAAHVFMVNLTVPFEVAGALISTILFVQWGAFGQLKRAAFIEAFLKFFAFGLAIPLQVSVALMGYYRVTALTTMVIINIGMMLVITGTTSVLFLTYGTLFVSRLGHRVGDDARHSAKRVQALAKAVRWIMLSGVMQLVVLFGTAAAFNVGFFYKPFGFNFCYLLIYIGITSQGLTHLMAFSRPVSNRRVGISMRNLRIGTSTRSSIGSMLTRAKSIFNTPAATHRTTQTHRTVPQTCRTVAQTYRTTTRTISAQVILPTVVMAVHDPERPPAENGVGSPLGLQPIPSASLYEDLPDPQTNFTPVKEFQRTSWGKRERLPWSIVRAGTWQHYTAKQVAEIAKNYCFSDDDEDDDNELGTPGHHDHDHSNNSSPRGPLQSYLTAPPVMSHSRSTTPPPRRSSNID